MKIKKMVASTMICCLCACAVTALPAHAAEVEGPDTGIHEEVVCLSDGISRVSWGKGNLTHANPLGRKPWAYATTSTYQGNAYRICARTECKSDGMVDYTSWAEQKNASTVSSATIIARTEKDVKFTGDHKLQDTSSSGWQYATTSASY